MKLLLKNINIISPGSKHHLTRKNIFIQDELIHTISAEAIDEKGMEVIDGTDLFVSCGWMDLHANFREPGHEYKENLESGARAAARGGFTTVLLMPSTEPVIADRSRAEYIFQRSKSLPVELIPAGSLSANNEGKDISEMYDMFQSGVRVFTDDKRPVSDSGLLIRALQYASHFGGKIFSFCNDKNIAFGGIINEGLMSASLGLKGIPAIAEEVMIAAQLFIARYTKAPLHFSTISTAGSVQLIREAKASGMKVTADVAALYLYFTEDDLASFDTNLKVIPPLRSGNDRDALIEGVIDGTIDCISSDHSPEDTENKKKEFALAAYGAAGIETAFAAARTAIGNRLSLPELISRFSTHPRCIAGIKTNGIEEGHPANLTLFSPDQKWVVSNKDLASKSVNNPFVGKELTGRVNATFCKGILTRSIN
jgi:dihydroorotase